MSEQRARLLGKVVFMGMDEGFSRPAAMDNEPGSRLDITERLDLLGRIPQEMQLSGVEFGAEAIRMFGKVNDRRVLAMCFRDLEKDQRIVRVELVSLEPREEGGHEFKLAIHTRRCG